MHQWTNGHARQLNERRRSRGKRGQKAGRPLAARCMQIKQKQCTGRLSLLVRERDASREQRERQGERVREIKRGREETEARRSKRTLLSRPAGCTPEVKRADTLFIITKLLRVSVVKGKPGKIASALHAGDNECPNRASIKARWTTQISLLSALVTRERVFHVR